MAELASGLDLHPYLIWPAK